MMPYWKESFGNPHSSEHAVGWKANDQVEKARDNVARLIGAEADEIVFTSGATESNNLAILGMAKSETRRLRIAVSPIEHKCVLASARRLHEDLGYGIDLLKVDGSGAVDLDHLAKVFSSGVSICSVGFVNNEIGTIQDIEKISELCREYEVLLHCDAAQAPVALELTDLANWADLVSLSAHKMYGPMGIGALYVRRELQKNLVPILVGGGQQNNLRSGTLPLPLVVGFGTAAELLSQPNAYSERERVRALRNQLASKILGMDSAFKINGPDLESRHPGNLNVRFVGYEAQDILAAMQPQLAASSGSACTSGIPEPSHVLRAIGLSSEEAESSVRFSIGKFTKDAEILEAANIISGALSRLV